MEKRPLYVLIATALTALKNCRERDEPNPVWEDRWERYLSRTELYLPHGGGFDVPPKIDTDEIRYNRIFIIGSFHPMDEHGGYRSWVDYRVTVYPSLQDGFYLSCTGGSPDLKERILDYFHYALKGHFDPDEFHDKDVRSQKDAIVRS